MITDEQIDRLSHIDDFVAFLQEVRDRRESTIQLLHEKADGSVQQIAGRILEADDILKMGGWEEIENRRKAR